ncbi:MAG TPA: helix-turn-helix domain-containing protein [Puia sp.]|jgi:YesN/AraC family two-component response regulator
MKLKMPDWLKSLFGPRRRLLPGDDQEFDAAEYIQHRLDLFMKEKRPYLQPHYTLKELSESIKVPAYQLSAIVNLRKGMNFSDYLNKLRVHHCLELIKGAKNRKINVSELATGCGFRNRNTFTNAFKKFTGRTPSEYIKQHEKK